MTLDRTAEGMTSKFTSQFIIPRSPGGCVSISVSAACVPLVTTQSLHSSSQARLHHSGLHTGATAGPGHRPGAGRGQVSGWAGVAGAGVCRVSRLHAAAAAVLL